jgi:hypothetical protein
VEVEADLGLAVANQPGLPPFEANCVPYTIEVLDEAAIAAALP